MTTSVLLPWLPLLRSSQTLLRRASGVVMGCFIRPGRASHGCAGCRSAFAAATAAGWLAGLTNNSNFCCFLYMLLSLLHSTLWAKRSHKMAIHYVHISGKKGSKNGNIIVMWWSKTFLIFAQSSSMVSAR